VLDVRRTGDGCSVAPSLQTSELSSHLLSQILTGTDLPGVAWRSDADPEPSVADQQARFRRWSITIGWMAILVAATLLLARVFGWILDLETHGAMRVSTLVCILCAGSSLVAWHAGRAAHLGRALAAGVAATGAITLGYYLLSAGGTARDALYGSGAIFGLVAPGRLSLPSSVILILLGLALLALYDGRSPRWRESLATAGTSLSLLALIGHLYHADELFAPFARRGIAVGPTPLLSAVCAGILIARPAEGLVSLLANDRSAGRVSRGLLGPVILVPVILGALSVAGVRQGLYDYELGMALVVVGTIAILCALVLQHSAALSRWEEHREELQARLVQAHRIDATRYLAGWMCHELNNLLTPVRA
jgi:hypothetical protein